MLFEHRRLSRYLTSTKKQWLGILLLAFLSGCGSNTRPNLHSVRGKVTWEGKAVPEGMVTFQPTSGRRPATGVIGKDGAYELASYEPGDGVLAGEYKVSIMAVDSSTQPDMVALTTEEEFELAKQGKPVPSATGTIGRRRGPPKWHIPMKYSDASRSGLKATVKAEDNEINFDLP